MALTPKKRLFADYLKLGMSKKEAAIEAGYSKATASQQGSKLAKDEDVIRYLKQLDEQAKTEVKKKQEVKVSPKVKELPEDDVEVTDPKEALLKLLNDIDPVVVLKAATALMPYMHARIAPAGKKVGEKEHAIEATKTGRFATLSQQSDKIQ